MRIVSTALLDPHFKYEIAARPGAESIMRCFACGTCTAGCPVSHVDAAYNPRRIIRMILLGMREEVLGSRELWLCARCYTCSANCPQDIDFSNIIPTLRDIAVREGHAAPDLAEKVEGISAAAHRARGDAIRALLDGRPEVAISAQGLDRAAPAPAATTPAEAPGKTGARPKPGAGNRRGSKST